MEAPHYATIVDGTQDGKGKVDNPYGVCVSRGRVLVTDIPKQRLVAYYQEDDAGSYKYLCEVVIQGLGLCVADENTGNVYVACQKEDYIQEVIWEGDNQRLRVRRTLTLPVGALPCGLSFDDGRSHLYVACNDGVKKFSLINERVVTTLNAPEGLNQRPEYVTTLGNKILVCYKGDKSLVIHDGNEERGRKITHTRLGSPTVVGNNGVNFLVADFDASAIFVLSTEGRVKTRLPPEELRPTALTAVEGGVYFTKFTDPNVYSLL